MAPNEARTTPNMPIRVTVLCTDTIAAMMTTTRFKEFNTLCDIGCTSDGTQKDDTSLNEKTQKNTGFSEPCQKVLGRNCWVGGICPGLPKRTKPTRYEQDERQGKNTSKDCYHTKLVCLFGYRILTEFPNLSVGSITLLAALRKIQISLN